LRIGAKAFAAAAAALASLAIGGPAVARADGPTITVQNGETQPAFSYQDAIRERVFIPVAGVDSDNDGIDDRISIDIIRPKESGPNLKVPAIIDDSPYYTSVGRGNETQYIHTTANGVLDKFPLFYDNFFVPRGYAVILADALGTGFSTGCPLHGGPGDVAGFKAVVDWLMGRVPGYTSITGNTPVAADWNNGKNAMIGKSYDGTFANGVASTGVDGLTTIVPISAISDWYDYSRMGGIRFNTHYPFGLSTTISSNVGSSQLGVVPPSRATLCGYQGQNQPPKAGSPFDTQLYQQDGDSDGDVNAFWQARNYNLDVSRVKAAVFESHGINDDNVKPNHMSQWWAGLAANNVPRKLWLSQEGHVDPFDYRRSAWVDTLHRWFDYWLQGVPNGIMDEPRVDIEQSPGNVWKTYADWPIPGTVNTDVYLGGRTAGTSGSLGLSSGGGTDTESFTDNNASETNQIAAPNGSQANRLVFLSPKLKTDLHVSGTPQIDLQASLSTAQSNLGAILVDYGTGTHVNAAINEGVTNTSTRDCWGDSSADTSGNALDSACYLEVQEVTRTASSFRVSKGILDSSNRDSLLSGAASPVTVGQKYEFKFPILPTDYTFPAGHQIGVIIVSNYRSYSSVAGTIGSVITVDTRNSKVVLPVTGGTQAATDSGGFVADTTAPVLAPQDMTVYSSDPTGTNVTLAPPVTDTQDPSPTVTCNPASGTRFQVGTTPVTCTATDANGNTSAPASFNVTVRYAAQTTGGVSGSVPSTLSLTLGSTPPSFGTFTPGLDHVYEASTGATVTSTAGDATLSVVDPDTAHPGHLVNGAFALPSALQAKATKAGTTGTAYNDVSGNPLNLLSWSAPVSSDAVTLWFSQHIGSNDALRTGNYAKTLTFTLSTTNP
jgi:X-Pro dipeptidyl-peptidase